MAYTFYLDGVQLPATPSKLDTKIKSNNKTINLINEGDVNVLKLPGLTELSFEALIPQVKYPFASTTYNASYYLSKLEGLKSSKKPFQFIVIRTNPSGKMLFNTNIKVSLEDYTISEDAKNGLDLKITIKLKQYKAYSTKTVKVVVKQETPKATVETQRPAETAPQKKTYTVKKGDCLWNIAKKYLGNGAKYTEIYNLNKDKIKNPNLIYVGQVLTLP